MDPTIKTTRAHILFGIEHAGTVERGRDSNRERDQGQPEARASPEKVEKEVKKTREISHSEKFAVRALDGHHRDYILLLFVGLAHKSTLVYYLFIYLYLFFLLFLFSDFRIVSHSPFACKWQNRFRNSEPVVACFLSNKGGIPDIRIPCNSSELHPAPCMCDVCRVHGLGPSCTLKQNVLSLILLISSVKLMNQKRGIYRHHILYPLRFGPQLPNDAQTLRPKASLEPNQISN